MPRKSKQKLSRIKVDKMMVAVPMEVKENLEEMEVKEDLEEMGEAAAEGSLHELLKLKREEFVLAQKTMEESPPPPNFHENIVVPENMLDRPIKIEKDDSIQETFEGTHCLYMQEPCTAKAEEHPINPYDLPRKDIPQMCLSEAYTPFNLDPLEPSYPVCSESEHQSSGDEMEDFSASKSAFSSYTIGNEELSSNSDEEETFSLDTFSLSKFTGVKWVKGNSSEPFVAEFKEQMGPRNTEGLERPIDFFLCLLQESFFDHLATQTNLYVTQQGKQFRPATSEEIKIFIAINILMGIKKLPCYRDYWSSSPEIRDNYISSQMSLNRFSWFLTNFHVNDNATMPDKNHPNCDKLYKIRPLVEHLKTNFQSYYLPTKEQAIGESVIKFKGKSSFKHYKPTENVKQGFKVWVRADMNGYVCDFEVNTDSDKRKVEKNLSEKVVLSLCKDLVGKNYHIYFDDFFTSIDLLEKMREKNLYCCGTVLQNRIGMLELKPESELVKGEYDYACCLDYIACVRWKDSKTVMMLSSIHSPTNMEIINRKQKNGAMVKIPCPKLINDYNRCMGGIEKSHILKSMFAIDRKSKKWWYRLLWHFIDVTVVNALILHNESKPKNQMTLKLFRASVVTGLVARSAQEWKQPKPKSKGYLPTFKRKVPIDKRFSQSKHLPVHCNSRRCAICSTRKDPHRTNWMCVECDVGLCMGKKRNCFQVFHKK